MEALYTIGVVRMAVGADEGAARAFSPMSHGPVARLNRPQATRFGCYARSQARRCRNELRRLACRCSHGTRPRRLCR